MAREELKEILTSAIRELEEAVKALVSMDNRTLTGKVWKAASDVEYATFLMSLSRRESEDEWKKIWKLSTDVDVGATLITAQNLLKQATTDLNSKDEEAYRKAWLARGHILNVQNKLDKLRARVVHLQRPS
ncbi:MAG: hypothetical protein QG670_40 [Thermoproteota archaeon]|nr:hypothetical protein [Thermoproteota archaeon]